MSVAYAESWVLLDPRSIDMSPLLANPVQSSAPPFHQTEQSFALAQASHAVSLRPFTECISLA